MTRPLPPAEPLGGPCSCGAVAATRVAAHAMCGACATELLDEVRWRVVARRDGVGQGRQAGPLRSDWGPNWALLECELCEASWVGPIEELCGYCSQRVDLQRVEQRLLLVHPDLPDRADKRRTEALKAWGVRLRVGHDAGTITRVELDAAWARETK